MVDVTRDAFRKAWDLLMVSAWTQLSFLGRACWKRELIRMMRSVGTRRAGCGQCHLSPFGRIKDWQRHILGCWNHTSCLLTRQSSFPTKYRWWGGRTLSLYSLFKKYPSPWGLHWSSTCSVVDSRLSDLYSGALRHKLHFETELVNDNALT